MPRYIDADLVRLGEVPYDEELSEYDRGWNDACEAIANTTPTADVQVAVQVQCKRGKWTHDGSKWANRFICSECGYKLFDEPTNFCPNCGADMRGADNEG